MPEFTYFTGSGFTGLAIPDMATAEHFLQLAAARISGNLDLWRNPGRRDGYATMRSLWADEPFRTAQAQQVFSHQLARAADIQRFLERLDPGRFRDATIRDEIINAPRRWTRAEYIARIAPRYRLEPELIAAIILTEQRDQSAAEDVADYYSGRFLNRVESSIGLGQLTSLTVHVHGLWNAIFDGLTPEWARVFARATTPLIAWLLTDDALNIHATAHYIRKLADAAAEVQASRRNPLMAIDPFCESQRRSSYVNYALQDLSILRQPASHWIDRPDPTLPATVPTNVRKASDGSPFPMTQLEWDTFYRGHYYVRLLGCEYTSCPFDQHFLNNGITIVYQDGDTGDWAIDDRLLNQDLPYLEWGMWVAYALGDVRRSGLFGSRPPA